MVKDASFIRNLAEKAGVILLQHQDTAAVYKKEGVSNYVTDADYASEKYIIETVKENFPTDVFISEESENTGFEEKAKGSFWVIDPLDGTNNFAYKRSFSVVSIAYGEKNEILMGAVYNPYTKEMYFAEKGKGSFCNDKKLTLPERESDHAMLLGTGPANEIKYSQKNLETLLKIKPLPHYRAFGAAAQEIAWVAAGKLDVFLHSNLNPWDVAAGYLIVKEAGGIMKNFAGEEATFLTPDIIVGHTQYVSDIISQITI